MTASPAGGKRVCIARIGAPHGVRGEVRLWSFTADPLAVASYGPLESAAGERFDVTALRAAKDCLVARFAGVSDRTAAERLVNLELFVPRAQLPEPVDAEEFYHADLIGLTAVDAAGTTLGTVIAIQNFGAGDLIEITPSAGGETLLLPFTKAVVPVIDVPAGRLVVVPPDGSFDNGDAGSAIEADTAET
ncbi:MAG: ribosome maturation factor RimM [Xanthobacteraceae bacterium]